RIAHGARRARRGAGRLPRRPGGGPRRQPLARDLARELRLRAADDHDLQQHDLHHHGEHHDHQHRHDDLRDGDDEHHDGGADDHDPTTPSSTTHHHDPPDHHHHEHDHYDPASASTSTPELSALQAEAFRREPSVRCQAWTAHRQPAT